MLTLVQAPLAGRYELIRRLGQGAYGTVYEALDAGTGERVAVKELTQVSPQTLAQFKQEFRAVQEVHHPNLVRLDALFEDHGKLHIAMELIEGSELLSHLYVDGELCFDEQQLRAVFLQLAEGLDALHGAGVVHRDLKPANVRVTAEGRVVLLDFGLAVAVDPRLQSTRGAVSGTVAYMAPEQAASHKVGPAADFYALGVCLYQALTGLLPIDAESPLGILTAKRHNIPAPPSEHVDGIPADLDQLCLALLQIAPERRPQARAIKRTLAPDKERASAAPAAGSRTARSAAFEGRDQELEQIEQAFARACAGAPQVVLVQGESGIGKSALVEHFTAIPRDVCILRSRCYENELLAYKAFDGAIDGLSRVLAALPEAECQALLPPHSALLARMFPALAAVRPLAQAPLFGLPADPSVQRLEAFAVFGRLIAGLSAQKPILFVIDDLQWADAESFRLLMAWLRGWPARCLLVATLRPDAELEADIAQSVAALRALACSHSVLLHGLPHRSATALARELLGPALPADWVELVVRESGGHPLFLTVLARFAESRDPRRAVQVTLDDAILARVGNLSSKGRTLVEIAALAGAPIATLACGRAAGLDDNELGQLVSELCRQKVLRRRKAGEIACFHDRIRRVVTEEIPRARAQTLHSRVAAALASHEQVDPAELARHHEAAGELGQAHEGYCRAADRALSSLAFARAAMLYGRALALLDSIATPPARRVALLVSHGHALARGGRSAEAARQYLAAAQLAEGEEQIRLRIWSAQHLLQSADLEAGLQSARSLLQQLDVPLPKGTPATLLQIAWDRTCLAVAGRNIVLVDEEIPAGQRMQLDALWGLSLPVSWLDPLASAAMSTRHVRLARAVGDRAHLGRALAEEAFGCALRNSLDPAAERLLGQARALSAQSSDPELEVCISFREAFVALVRWDLPRARERLEHAQRVGSEGCPTEPWLLTNVRINLGAVWHYMGEHARLAAAATAWIEEAQSRNDHFALSLIDTVGGGYLRHLMADDLPRARSTLAAASAQWPREPFSFVHFGELHDVTCTELYAGGQSAHDWLERERPRLARAFLLKLDFGKTIWLMVRAASALRAHHQAAAADRPRLLQQSRGYTRTLARVGVKLASQVAASFEAQFASLADERPRALQLAREARQASDASGYGFLAHSMRYLEGLLVGGDSGAKTQHEALRFFAGQGWTHPRRAMTIVCPALDELEARA
jgi:eukaryotic-like serine/threonine-protein kinase